MPQNRLKKRCVSVYKLKSIKKEVTKCDSLKVRHEKQYQRILNNSNSILRITREKDSLRIVQQKIRKDYQTIKEELIKQKSKKGISIFDSILIGVGAFGIGALLF